MRVFSLAASLRQTAVIDVHVFPVPLFALEWYYVNNWMSDKLFKRPALRAPDRIKPGSHWRQSRKDVRHSGDRVGRIGDRVGRVGDNVDRDKLSNSNCCRFVSKTGNKVHRIDDSRLCRRFRQQSTLSPVCTGLYASFGWLLVCRA